jgi:hypothetical protein
MAGFFLPEEKCLPLAGNLLFCTAFQGLSPVISSTIDSSSAILLKCVGFKKQPVTKRLIHLL